MVLCRGLAKQTNQKGGRERAAEREGTRWLLRFSGLLEGIEGVQNVAKQRIAQSGSLRVALDHDHIV